MAASWNSFALEITYYVLGWIAFFSWSFSFYPQVILNFTRKNVVGLNMNYLILNLTRHTAYLIYNASLYFSPVVQWQYYIKYGFGETIPVAANDVAFSIHAVLLTSFTLFQVSIYERGSNHITKTTAAITCIVWISAAVCVFIALPNRSWLWLISVFNIIQVIMTVIKFMPQVFMNFERKSTIGWSIGGVLLVLIGGGGNFTQMAVQAIDLGSWANLSRNIGKTLLSLVSIFYALLFVLQHYVLYRSREGEIPRNGGGGNTDGCSEEEISPNDGGENTAPLLKSSDPFEDV